MKDKNDTFADEANVHSERLPKKECDIELLIHAAASTYRVKKVKENKTVEHTDFDPPKKEAATYEVMHQALSERGYHFTDKIIPGVESNYRKLPSPLAATCMAPIDEHDKGPIVIAFRGTKALRDIYSDAKIISMGVVEKKFRDDAYDFYKEMRAKYPDREIILTGHSLGGHLAQYVAMKAYQESDDKNLPNVLVRTFNSAPIKTTHDAVLNRHPELITRFVNYRLSTDVVSSTKVPFQAWYGDIFNFRTKKVNSHNISNMLKDLPDEVRSQRVGGQANEHKLLQEQIQGVFESYQSRVQGMWLSWLGIRKESGNDQLFNEKKQQIMEALDTQNYPLACEHLLELKESVRGTVPLRVIDNLLRRVESVNMNTEQKQIIDTKYSDELNAVQQKLSLLYETSPALSDSTKQLLDGIQAMKQNKNVSTTTLTEGLKTINAVLDNPKDYLVKKKLIKFEMNIKAIVPNALGQRIKHLISQVSRIAIIVRQKTKPVPVVPENNFSEQMKSMKEGLIKIKSEAEPALTKTTEEEKERTRTYSIGSFKK